MHKVRIITTREPFITYLCTLLETWWKFHVGMARYLYAHMLKKSWDEPKEEWNVFNNNLRNFLKVDKSSYAKIVGSIFTIENKNQVSTFDTCTKCN
jgi:hypothetical protein